MTVSIALVPKLPVEAVSEESVTVVPGARFVIGPLSETLCGLPLALSVINSDPVLNPLVVGVKLTLIWQLAPAPRLLPQLFACAKSPLLEAILVMLSALVPLLVSVTCCAVTVLPVPSVAKFKVELESVALVPAAVTVSAVEPVVDPEAAWIVLGPAATPCAIPAEFIVATPVFEEVHVTELVMS